MLWGLLRVGAFRRMGGSVIDRALALSNAHQVSVGAALERGVRASVTAVSGALGARAADQALTIVYRILFLLFAEARGLVPMWHPTYRKAYAIGTLTEQALAGSSRGLWAALQATSRLAHAGCHAGELVVTPFNGRLFEPARTPLAESRRVNDATVREVLLALSTTSGDGGGRRVSYRDLDVEQLGAVYESVLDLTTVSTTDTNRSVRKQTGSFYTPRSITEYLVRRTLHPLVERRSAREILSLRVLDLAMGSGAFLVAACRYLATACERAMIRDGQELEDVLDQTCRDGAANPPDPSETGDLRNLRVSAVLRRAVAQRCLFGVDLNPTAVQLGRLSLWLATLAADRPLTFLDHRLRDGDSLVGASIFDLLRQPPGLGARRGPRAAQNARTSLFDLSEDFERSLGETASGRMRIAEEPGDTLAAVRGKERALAALGGREGPLARWRELANLWCAAWFWPDLSDAPDRREYVALAAEIGGGTGVLPSQHANRRLAVAAATSRERRFLHWTLEFPEVFFDAVGSPLGAAGFDAILGNPPWEMLRGDHRDAAALVRFARGGGMYRLQGRGHANLYQLFLERALTLLAPGGRVGLVLPLQPGARSRVCGSAPPPPRPVRSRFDRRLREPRRGLSNSPQSALSPGHRDARRIERRDRVPLRRARSRRAGSHSGWRRAPREAFPVTLTTHLIARLSGDQLVIPEIRSPIDLAIAEKAAAAPPLGSDTGWGARFGRELNATDDAEVFRPPRQGLPIIEGKQLTPFAVDPRAARFQHPDERRAGAASERTVQPGAARLSRRRVREQPALPHRRDRPIRVRHHAYGLLSEGREADRGPARPLRTAEQLRRELSGSPADRHTPLHRHRRTAAGPASRTRIDCLRGPGRAFDSSRNGS